MGGLSDLKAPSDPHICAVSLQNLFEYHEGVYLRVPSDTEYLTFPFCVAACRIAPPQMVGLRKHCRRLQAVLFCSAVLQGRFA